MSGMAVTAFKLTVTSSAVLTKPADPRCNAASRVSSSGIEIADGTLTGTGHD